MRDEMMTVAGERGQLSRLLTTILGLKEDLEALNANRQKLSFIHVDSLKKEFLPNINLLKQYIDQVKGVLANIHTWYIDGQLHGQMIDLINEVALIKDYFSWKDKQFTDWGWMMDAGGVMIDARNLFDPDTVSYVYNLAADIALRTQKPVNDLYGIVHKAAESTLEVLEYHVDLVVRVVSGEKDVCSFYHLYDHQMVYTPEEQAAKDAAILAEQKKKEEQEAMDRHIREVTVDVDQFMEIVNDIVAHSTNEGQKRICNVFKTKFVDTQHILKDYYVTKSVLGLINIIGHQDGSDMRSKMETFADSLVKANETLYIKVGKDQGKYGDYDHIRNTMLFLLDNKLVGCVKSMSTQEPVDELGIEYTGVLTVTF